MDMDKRIYVAMSEQEIDRIDALRADVMVKLGYKISRHSFLKGCLMKALEIEENH